MRRQDNPILLWLVAATQWRAGQLHPDEREYELGVYDTMASYRRACRWLDAEDAYRVHLYNVNDVAAVDALEVWQITRMEEAGVL